jgi:hypothetical protein
LRHSSAACGTTASRSLHRPSMKSTRSQG